MKITVETKRLLALLNFIKLAAPDKTNRYNLMAVRFLDDCMAVTDGHALLVQKFPVGTRIPALVSLPYSATLVTTLRSEKSSFIDVDLPDPGAPDPMIRAGKFIIEAGTHSWPDLFIRREFGNRLKESKAPGPQEVLHPGPWNMELFANIYEALRSAKVVKCSFPFLPTVPASQDDFAGRPGFFDFLGVADCLYLFIQPMTLPDSLCYPYLPHSDPLRAKLKDCFEYLKMNFASKPCNPFTPGDKDRQALKEVVAILTEEKTRLHPPPPEPEPPPDPETAPNPLDVLLSPAAPEEPPAVEDDPACTSCGESDCSRPFPHPVEEEPRIIIRSMVTGAIETIPVAPPPQPLAPGCLERRNLPSVRSVFARQIRD